MTIYEAEHYTDAEREEIVANYPEHERDARAKGIPMMGSGLVYPVADSQIIVEPFEIPKFWPLLGALDFGWDHPTAAVKMAFDGDADVLYITNEYRVRQRPAFHHAAALKAWGPNLVWVWPHDGLQHDKQAGKPIAQEYRDHGLNMRDERVMFEDGSISVEAAIVEILDRMETGRIKVFSTCVAWLEERRMYHRKDGRVVAQADDLMAATRYAVMGKRFAKTTAQPDLVAGLLKGAGGGNWLGN